MKRINMSVGEAVIRYLDNQYVSFDGKEEKFVEGVCAVFGHGCVLGMGEALAMAEHSLKVYQGKNEQGMAHVAMSYAKQNNRRKIMPCISSIGPGAANMVTAAACATVNNIPLLLLPGDTYATRRPDPVLQQLEQTYDLNVTTNDAYKAVTRYFDRISRPEMLESALNNAMRALTDTAHTGAVCIAMPQDVQGETYDFPAYMFEKRVHRITRPVAVEEELNELAEAIKESKYPLVIVGGGARYSEAGKVIEDFCKAHNVPFAETQAGKSTIPCTSPYYLGGLGVTGNGCANEIAMRADLIIGLGTRFTDFTTASKTLFNEDAKVVTINTSTFHGRKMNAVYATGDVKATLSAVESKIQGYESAYTEEYKNAQEKWAKEMERLTSIKYSEDLIPEVKALTPTTLKDFNEATGSKLAQTTALGIVREMIEKDAIVVGAAGSLPGDMQRMWETEELYTYNMEYGYSCMGYEIQGALGSKLACPDKEVYAMCGDGSYLMLHSELVTAMQEGVKINVLLFDNGGFGCINNLQMGKGIKSLATEFRYGAKADTPFVPVNYALSASGYGLKTYSATTEEELRVALEEIKKQSVSTLIDIKVLPKTMTDGYEGGFWQCGVTHNPRNNKQQEALQDLLDHIK